MILGIREEEPANEMAASASKCGIMAVNGDKQVLIDMDNPPSIGGELIPIVESLSYLGIPITSNLDTSVIIRQRYEKSVKIMQVMRPFLGCQLIPVWLRLRILNSVIVAKLMYGAEIFGMKKAATSIFQVHNDPEIIKTMLLLGGEYYGQSFRKKWLFSSEDEPTPTQVGDENFSGDGGDVVCLRVAKFLA